MTPEEIAEIKLRYSTYHENCLLSRNLVECFNESCDFKTILNLIEYIEKEINARTTTY